MKKRHDNRVFVSHMLECIEQLEVCFAKGKETFQQDKIVRAAVLRFLQEIGECAKDVSAEFRMQHPDIPWKEMAGMRDVLVHDYLGVDMDIVYDVVRNRMPSVKQALMSINVRKNGENHGS